MPLTDGCLPLATERLLLTVVQFPGIFIFSSLLPLPGSKGNCSSSDFLTVSSIG